MGNLDTNKRFEDILVTLKRFAQGEYPEPLPISDNRDEIDALCEALNELGLALRRRQQDVEKKQAKISSLRDILSRYTALDFSQRATVHDDGDEIDALAAGLNTLGEKVKEASDELESFTHSVSHDLRAPLRAIHGYSEMLTEDYESKLDQEGVRQLNAVKYNARRMGQLVDDLLTLSKVAKRSLSETEIDVTMLVHDVVKDVDETEKKRARISVRPLGTAFGDVTLLRQALRNLLSNALKYSGKKDFAEVEIGVTRENGAPIYYVKDNGAGFDMAYYEKLFGVFQRLHGQDEFDGTGVGLAIVQRIIHRHGGKVWAESRVGEGATFYFTLSGSDRLASRNGAAQGSPTGHQLGS